MFGSIVADVCGLRALLRLRISRRATRVWLLWRHHCEPAWSEDGIEKSRAACSRSLFGLVIGAGREVLSQDSLNC